MDNDPKIHAKKIRKRSKVLSRSIRSRLLLKKLNKVKRPISKSIQSFTFDYVLKNMSALLNKRTPFKIKDVPHIFNHDRAVEEEIGSLLGECNIGPLDISISATKEFSGHYSAHNTISLKFQDFLNYKGPYNLYLAQIPLYERLSKQVGSLEPDDVSGQGAKFYEENENNLKKVINKSNALTLFCFKIKDHIDRLNLWFSKKDTFSSLHYDSYDNFLFMLAGQKTFSIYPPNSREVVCESVLTNSFQQARSLEESIDRVKCTVLPNEAIFVPQGWFHEVASTGTNIAAINFWFSSIERLCGGREKYLFRYLVAYQIDKELTDVLEQYSSIIIKLFEVATPFRPFESSDYKERVRLIVENENKNEAYMINLFMYAILKTPEISLRSLLVEAVNYNPVKLQYILCNLDEKAVEILTKKLEQIDKHTNISNSQGVISSDDFYNLLRQKIDFQSVTDYFLTSKKRLREHTLKNVLFEKLSGNFEF